MSLSTPRGASGLILTSRSCWLVEILVDANLIDGVHFSVSLRLLLDASARLVEPQYRLVLSEFVSGTVMRYALAMIGAP